MNPFARTTSPEDRGARRRPLARLLDVRWLSALVSTLTVTAALGVALPNQGGPAVAGQTACTPDSGYSTCVRFTYSGGDQSFTVPAGVNGPVLVKAWGAGGGGVDAAYYNQNSGGGGGGFASGNLTAASGTALTIVVGQAGRTNGSGNPRRFRSASSASAFSASMLAALADNAARRSGILI